MSLQNDFESATRRVQTLGSAPDNATLLALYALFKQATAGDVSGKQPSRLKLRERAKYDAWAEKQGMSHDEAKEAYIALVNTLLNA
ncbi:acyl-CoA-binding protein [Lujinxingia litoralis]|uniref:Acyl-CoA-binding protein n=1 Tax=Lujinxingia litoralis TaxID=2211119 RepID=A0A328CD22_9DELT|nr:acyl-CoA-binding protein [Lujinxingia litoralis]RAL25211.1 acyl-CoA-binding protein [Lujinxingia litoralis]